MVRNSVFGLKRFAPGNREAARKGLTPKRSSSIPVRCHQEGKKGGWVEKREVE